MSYLVSILRIVLTYEYILKEPMLICAFFLVL